MFSTVYLRLEEVPPLRIGMLEPVQMKTQIAGTCMMEDDFFSITFMLSTIYLMLYFAFKRKKLGIKF